MKCLSCDEREAMPECELCQPCAEATDRALSECYEQEDERKQKEAAEADE